MAAFPHGFRGEFSAAGHLSCISDRVVQLAKEAGRRALDFSGGVRVNSGLELICPFLTQLPKTCPKYFKSVVDVEDILRECFPSAFAVNQYFVSKKTRRVGNSYLHLLLKWEAVSAL